MGCYTADKNPLCLTADGAQREIDGGRRPFPLETEESGYVDAVPDVREDVGSLAFHEAEVVVTTVRTVIGCELHQAKWGVFVRIARFDEQHVLLGHCVEASAYGVVDFAASFVSTMLETRFKPRPICLTTCCTALTS